MDLFASTSGGGSAVIVLLHGFGGSGAVWERVVPLLAPHMKVLTYDLPGHRRSAGHDDWSSPRRIAGAIAADLDRRGLDRVHLGGHSLGGAVATVMALARPEAVASLGLVAPGGMGAKINAGLLRRFAAAQDAGELRQALEIMHGPGSPVTQDDIDAQLAWRNAHGNRERLVALAERITPDGGQGVFGDAALRSLAMPVGVLWGTRDAVVPVAQADDLPGGFAVTRLGGAGHMLPQEEPEAVADLLLRTTVRAA